MNVRLVLAVPLIYQKTIRSYRMLCNYCNQNVGKFTMPNGRLCCQKHFNLCPEIQRKKTDGNFEKMSEARAANIFENWSGVANNIIRRAFITLHPNANCFECNSIPVWNNKPLKLELDHIDGESKNNGITNLRLLCPNCHSQTPTFRKKKLRKVISDKDLLRVVDSHDSIRLALFSLGLSTGSGNYERVRKLQNNRVH